MISIRKATLKDVKVVSKLSSEFIKYHDKVVSKNNSKLKPYITKKKNLSAIFKKFVIKNIRSRNGLVLIAEDDGKPIGYSLSYIKDNIPLFAVEKIGYLSDLYVEKKYRGKRISSKFKDKVFKWLKKKGIKHVSICVYLANPKAIKIYKKWGFFDFYTELRMKV